MRKIKFKHTAGMSDEKKVQEFVDDINRLMSVDKAIVAKNGNRAKFTLADNIRYIPPSVHRRLFEYKLMLTGGCPDSGMEPYVASPE